MERCSVVPYEGDKGYLFISYSHKDSVRVVPIIERLSKEGYRIWYDEGIDPGSEWPETIASHLGGAAACVGLISDNYFASPNCRRELNFALKKQIPYLSIMLEDAQMSAGVEMQLSANQAIFKYKMPEEAFYKKVNATKILSPAREIPEPPAKPVEQKPTPPVEPVKPVQPEPEVQKVQTQKPKKKSKKGLVIGLCVLAAVIVIGAVIAIVSSSKKPEPTVLETTPTLTSIDIDDSKVKEATNSNSDTLLGSGYAKNLFWGQKTQTEYKDKDAFIKGVKYMDVSLDSSTTNISVFPYSIEVQGNEHPDIIKLTYYDKVGTEYIVQGSFEINGGSLVISSCKSVYDGARIPDEDIIYKVSRYYGSITLGIESDYSSINYSSDSDKLSGTAGDKVYNEIKTFDIPKPANGAACDLLFDDGGFSKDAKLSSYYDNISVLYIEWKKEQRLYNGTMADFDVQKRVSFNFFNTAPYGFILFTDDGEIFPYQTPYEP